MKRKISAASITLQAQEKEEIVDCRRNPLKKVKTNEREDANNETLSTQKKKVKKNKKSVPSKSQEVEEIPRNKKDGLQKKISIGLNETKFKVSNFTAEEKKERENKHIEDEEHLSQSPSIKARGHTQFNDLIWKLDEYFAKTIMKKGKFEFSCKSCSQVDIPENWSSGYFENLETHLGSKTHRANSGLDKEKLEEIIALLKNFKKGKINVYTSNYSKDQQIHLKFALTAFLVSEGLPYNKTDPLVNFVKKITTEYSQADINKLSLSNVTASNIATHCIGKTLRNLILDEIATTPFSLSVDESSDVYGDAYLAVTAKYVKEKKIVTKLLSVIPLGQEKTGEAFYHQTKQEIFSGENAEQIEKNFIGICTDRGSNMQSSKGAGMSNRLANDYPYIAIIPDFSHIYNNIAEKAVKELDSSIIKIVKTTSNYFSRSHQRSFRLKEIQKAQGRSGQDILEVIQYASTRFLSLYESTARILELWPCLSEYQKEDSNLAIDFNEKNKVLLLILLSLLEKLSGANEFFQNNHLFFPEIHEKLMTTFSTFAQLIVKTPPNKGLSLYEEFTFYYDMPWEHKANINKLIDDPLVIKSKYLDWEFLDSPGYFDNFDTQEQEGILKNIQNFIIISLAELKNKAPLQDPLFVDSDILHIWSIDLEKWKRMAAKFYNLISQGSKFANELREIAFALKGSTLQFYLNSTRHNIVDMWEGLKEKYPVMSKLALGLLVLPSSTAPVERIFSVLKNIKTPRRNRILTENLEATLLCKQYFKEDSIEISKEMVEKYHTLWRKQENESTENLKKSPSINFEESKEILPQRNNNNEPFRYKVFCFALKKN